MSKLAEAYDPRALDPARIVSAFTRSAVAGVGID
jgi:hypothetical protein